MKKYIIAFTLIFALILNTYSQTTLSGGIVSGTWTKSGSPYKVNGNITIPNGSTLSIEPGVVVQFAQFKYLNVDGQIKAVGGQKSSDSIWFTKQNPNDTGSWKGIKFIKTANTNDTSVFKYCVFRNCKSIYDTLLANRSGGITVIGYGKLKINNCTFYKNEASIGASVFITTNAYASIKACTFKNNSACRFWWYNGVGTSSFRPKGSAISIEYNSKAIIDSCIFNNNTRGNDYRQNPTLLYDASILDVEGYTSKNKSSVSVVTNSTFDKNEGINIYAYDKADVTILNSNFINAPKDKSRSIIYSNYNSSVSMDKCILKSNQCTVLLDAESAKINFSNGLIQGNYNYISSIVSGPSGISPYLKVTGSKIINNYGSINSKDNSIEGTFSANWVSNCLIANNNLAGVFYGDILYNSTVVNNRSSKFGILGYNLTCKNSIIWGNKSDSFPNKQIFNYPSSYNSFLNCIVQNDTGSFAWPRFGYNWIKPSVYKNNLSANPQFVNPTAGAGVTFDATNADFSVKNSCALFSPTINQGAIDTLYMGLPKYDLVGNPRFYENRIDIGAYENVNGFPTIIILKQAKNDTLCEKSRPAQLTMSAIGKGLSYQWQQSINGGSVWADINGQTNNQFNLNTSPNQNTILYRALLNGSCDKDTSQNFIVITNPLPIVSLGKDTGICKNASINKAVSSNGSYLWHTGNTSNSLNQKIIKDTTWWLQVKSTEGCFNRDTIKITSYPLPAINLGADKSIDKKAQLTLDAGAGHSKYLWSDASTQVTKTFLGSDLGPMGKYTIWAEVTNTFGCSARDTIVITVTDNSGIHPILSNPIKLYPQPSNSILNIEIPNTLINHSLELNIITLEGKLLINEKLVTNQQSIDISLLEAGVYLIEVNDKSNGQVYTIKWVKG